MPNLECYIDADGRVTCSTETLGGQSARLVAPLVPVSCCVDQHGIVHCADPAHPLHMAHVSYAPWFGLSPSQIPACRPTAPNRLPGSSGKIASSVQRPTSNPAGVLMQTKSITTTSAKKASIVAAPAKTPSSASPTPRPAGTAGTHLVARQPAAQCCVHILTDGLSGITPQNPKPGRMDCPETPEWHERDVTVIGIQGDGTGGTLARVLFEKMPGSGGVQTPAPWLTARMQNVSVAPKLIPVCTAGPQDKRPVDCCLAYARDGRTLVVQCKDPSHPLHNKPADQAMKEGYTLGMCAPPPAVPPCCFELGDFGNGNNARLICEDESHPAHGKAVRVSVSTDGASAVWRGQIDGSDYVLEMPVCVIEDQPDEVNCCIRNGVLECPGAPYHGMPYESFKRKYPNMRLMPCPEVPPPPPPPDCCVRIQGNRAFLVCSQQPWNGYELKPNEFQCQDTPQGTVCRVILQTAGQSAARAVMFPVCGPGQEPIPPDCCYDVGTGRLICSDTSSQYHNLVVSLIDLQSGLPASNGYALVWHKLFGSVPMKFPICDVPVPEQCCFQPPDGLTPGVKGKLVCPGSELDGKSATLIAVGRLPNGTMIASVSYLGGASRMPVCAPPSKKVPPPPSKIPTPGKQPPPGKRIPPPPSKIPTPGECPPCYFCCVNLDTGRFVCPASPELHGKPAIIQQVIEIQGSPWVVLGDGTKVPACGIECPPPTPECPPLLIPPGDPGTNTPPGPRVPPPCEPPPEIPSPPPGTNTPPGPPGEPPCEPTPTIPTMPPGTNTPPGPPGQPPCEPSPVLPSAPPWTNTPPGPPGQPPCEPSPVLPSAPPWTNTPPGPPGQPPCEPSPVLPSAPPWTNTPPGPPAPYCTPDTKPTIPTAPPGTNTPSGPPSPACPPGTVPTIPGPYY